jgi:BirA family biotin operon repressor/biotin-[acetyl-CoA-carboxylase] ligase
LSLSISPFNKNWTIHRFDEIDSTNSWLKDNRDILPDKSVAVAAFQTAGRGRLGRKWSAPTGTALMFSILLRPNWPIVQSSWLMMIAGLAAAEALSETSGVPIQLKWPNDIVYMTPNGLHKMGGILSEATTDNGLLAEAIIGIGLNVNMTSDQLPSNTSTPACSLQSITGDTFKLEPILDTLLQHFENYYQAAANGISPLSNWQNELTTIGQSVTATLVPHGNISGTDAKKVDGVAVGVDEWGRLLIKTSLGAIEPVIAGDVTLRKS